MKFLDLLRKLGIFRSGSISSTYTSEKDRPTEFLMDDIADAKKDLTTEEDIKKLTKSITTDAKPNPEKVSLGRKIFFWIIIVLGVLFLIGFLSSGFSFSFVVFLVLWGGLAFMLKKFAFQGFYAWWVVIVTFVIVFFSTLAIFPSSDDTDSSTSSSTSSSDLKKYDGKVYEISGEGGKVKGTAAVKAKENKDGKAYLSVVYQFFIKDNIPMVPSTYCNNSPAEKSYHYVGNILKPLSKENRNAVGTFSTAYCNRDARPEDPFSTNNSKLYQCPKPPTTGTLTDTFVPNFSDNFYSVEEFMAVNTFEVYDASTAWDKDEDGTGCVGNDDKAVSQGKKIRSYVFEMTERK